MRCGVENPEGGGTPCSAFDLMPANPEAVGYRNTYWPSWGGHPVQWTKGAGADHKWHLFTPQFANGCTVDNWIKNSFVVHAVGETPTGPWAHHDVAIPVWAHGSQATQDPSTGDWLLYFVGGWHYPPSQWTSCQGLARPGQHQLGSGTARAGAVPLPAVGDCGPAANAGCGIR